MFPSVRTRSIFIVCCAIGFQLPVAGFQAPPAGSQSPGAGSPSIADQQPAPTMHAALPQDVDDYWLVPSARERKTAATTALATAARAYAAGDYSAALTSAQHAATGQSALSDYALFYQGVALLRLARPEEAEKAFDTLMQHKPGGYLAIAAALGKGEALESRGNHAAVHQWRQQVWHTWVATGRALRAAILVVFQVAPD